MEVVDHRLVAIELDNKHLVVELIDLNLQQLLMDLQE
jgi:hypothetical protein